jgi:hypothetical protein
MTKRNQKNKDQNWYKKLKIMFWLKGKIEKNNNFYKGSRKKIEIKTTRTKLKNIIPSI